MRTITTDYRDAQILDLGSGYEKGPFLVTQMGVAANEPVPKTKMFVLRPDGRWVDFNAYACKGKPKAMDELVFSTMAEVINLRQIDRTTSGVGVAGRQGGSPGVA